MPCRSEVDYGRCPGNGVHTKDSSNEDNQPSDVKCKPFDQVPAYKQPPECGSSESMQAVAEAAQEEITLEKLRNIDTSTVFGEDLVIALGNCQVNKYVAENGQQVMDQWSEEFADRVASAPADDVPSVQEEMIKEGYSRSMVEIQQYM